MANVDPRKEGETWHSFYWNMDYTVMFREKEWFVVKWEDGTTSEHCTKFDPRDKKL